MPTDMLIRLVNVGFAKVAKDVALSRGTIGNLILWGEVSRHLEELGNSKDE